MKILVTGGCGFIGSNFVKYILTSPEIKSNAEIINLDKQTYAGHGKNIEHMGLAGHERYRFVKGDICDNGLVGRIFSDEKPEVVFNFAAESHVDRSIESSADFALTNVVGTVVLLDAAKRHNAGRFVHISTDEVYGSIDKGSFSENSDFNPANPYSASKAAAEIIALSYFKTHKLPLVITRSANNYGPYQFPEKLLSKSITNLIQGRKVPLMWSKENPGLNVRDWLHVKDNCRGIWVAAQKGKEGQAYNIPGGNEMANREVIDILLKHFNCGEQMVEHIAHRKAHDFRYSITGDKLRSLGFECRRKDLKQELKTTVEWYVKNENWWGPLKK